ncbi:hypothetical protein [Mariprofundus ferrooxydans]|uniref:hypothetical protein n=1 Tax=Mariprofundus ferrooxydans TaxID=314344 RepID=UPI00143207C6|nr:hypothetical protein [Mariprofundus ferrooxydans]
MANIFVTHNTPEIISRINRLAELFPKALDKGLGKWVLRANRLAKYYLSGEGGTGVWERHNIGGYPVPVRTGHLRRLQNYILPGRSKSGVSMRHGQGALIDTAAYAESVSEGTGTHSRYGKRRFQVDAIQNSHEAGIADVMDALRAARAAAQ